MTNRVRSVLIGESLDLLLNLRQETGLIFSEFRSSDSKLQYVICKEVIAAPQQRLQAARGEVEELSVNLEETEASDRTAARIANTTVETFTSTQ